VQFQTGTDLDWGRVAGRVEHVASSRTANFESLTELLELINRMLKDKPRN
jgi:hypothetical protein